MNNQVLDALTILTQILMKANIAAPIVAGLIGGIARMFAGLTGNPEVKLSEVADRIAAGIDVNDARGLAELARLRALIA